MGVASHRGRGRRASGNQVGAGVPPPAPPLPAWPSPPSISASAPPSPFPLLPPPPPALPLPMAMPFCVPRVFLPVPPVPLSRCPYALSPAPSSPPLCPVPCPCPLPAPPVSTYAAALPPGLPSSNGVPNSSASGRVVAHASAPADGRHRQGQECQDRGGEKITTHNSSAQMDIFAINNSRQGVGALWQPYGPGSAQRAGWRKRVGRLTKASTNRTVSIRLETISEAGRGCSSDAYLTKGV